MPEHIEAVKKILSSKSPKRLKIESFASPAGLPVGAKYADVASAHPFKRLPANPDRGDPFSTGSHQRRRRRLSTSISKK